MPAGAASFERIARFEPELRDAPLVEKGYRCISVTTTAAFEALEPRWRALLSHSATPSPFFSWEFAVEWLRHFVKISAAIPMDPALKAKLAALRTPLE